MSVLDNFEPKRVMKYFEEICAIPHGSRDSEKIADYCVEFAKAHGLEWSRDKSNNVVIKKKKHPRSKCADTVIIQGHLDMVCAKTSESDIDFKKDGLKLCADDKFIWAENTTLGGDDGIAVAMALAILESDNIIHPALECVFTTDEEIGMLGASALDMSGLKGKYLLNIDSEDEGEFTVSCAGGATLTVNIPLERKTAAGKGYKITVAGLTGGHSGVEIDKGRANSIILLGDLLQSISDDIEIISVKGGEKDNAIARTAEAVVISKKEPDLTRKEEEYKKKYKQTDPNLSVTVTECETEKNVILNKEDVIKLLSGVPNGVKEMSKAIDGLVETSSNFGIFTTDEEKLTAVFSVRSSAGDKKQALMREISDTAESCGGTVSVEGEYPAWEYKENSHLRDTAKKVFCEQYGKEPIIAAIHAGLECGIFCGKKPELDCISFGPDIKDIHTPREKLDIKSTERVYQFLIGLLENI